MAKPAMPSSMSREATATIRVEPRWLRGCCRLSFIVVPPPCLRVLHHRLGSKNKSAGIIGARGQQADHAVKEQEVRRVGNGDPAHAGIVAVDRYQVIAFHGNAQVIRTTGGR